MRTAAPSLEPPAGIEEDSPRRSWIAPTGPIPLVEADPMSADYVRTVQLLLAAAPAIFDTPAPAMKRGTALSLFVQDMP